MFIDFCRLPLLPPHKTALQQHQMLTQCKISAESVLNQCTAVGISAWLFVQFVRENKALPLQISAESVLNQCTLNQC